ncbi:MAG: carboxymuconolactone decarboxylase family protein [Acidimicrobiales bacterium]
MGEAQDVLDGLRESARSLRGAAPEAWQGFAALHNAALADGVLPGYVKELMALVIAVSKECDGCIASHARGAARKGATAEQVAEALSVAILMNGGPATVYGPRAWAAFNEFAARGAAPADSGADSGAGSGAGT